MTVRIEQGKGAKDRYVPLAARLLHELRAYCKTGTAARLDLRQSPGRDPEARPAVE